MKSTNIIILSVTVCFGGIIFFSACKYSYQSKVSELKDKTRNAFTEVLRQELKSRNVEGDFSFFFDSRTVTVDMPDSVYLEDASGRHAYWLDPEKHCMNIADDVHVRSLQSISFLKYPIVADSLNSMWGEWLQRSGVSAQSALCVSVTGNDGNVKTENTFQSEWRNASNLMFTIYVGYACEIKVMGYLHYSVWRIMYMKVLFYLLLYIVCVYEVYKMCIIVGKKLPLVWQTERIEVPIIKVVEGVNDTPVRSYLLHGNIIFYAERKMVEVDGIKKKIQPQASSLLELFLKDKEYILKDPVIMDNLWPDGTGSTERLHKAVGRLRSFIHEIDASIDIVRGVETYQLLLN